MESFSTALKSGAWDYQGGRDTAPFLVLALLVMPMIVARY
jgi:hypothetical protein